jgi:hypothetical protein
MLFAATLLGVAATPAAGGSLGETKVDPSLKWQSDCQAPVRPTLFFDTVEGYNQALAQYNTHVAQVRRYIQCVQSDGKADIDALAATVASGMQAQQNAALKANEDLRTDFEVQRSLLQ